MTAPLHDLLDDLATSERLLPSGLAEGAWTDGRTRRRRRRLVHAGAAVAAVLVVLLVLGPLAALAPRDLPGPSFAGSSAAAVDGHPERIERQWWVRELPDQPGPVAALLQAVDEQETHDDPDGWYAVAADGHRWRLPGDAVHDHHPALSPDGRLLGQLLGDDGPYVVHDLVTGERTVFEDVGAAVSDRGGARYQIGLQTPSSWSPDGRRIVVSGHPGPLLLDVRTGEVTELPRPGPLAGFAGPDRLAWLVGDRLVLTDLRGRAPVEVGLEPTGGPLPDPFQWTGTVSPDGQVLAVTEGEQVRRFSTQDGAELAAPVTAPLAGTCGAAFGSTPDVLVVPTLSDGGLVAERVEARSTWPMTVVADGVGGRCLVWATAALDAPPRAAPLVRPEVLLLVAGVAGAALVLALRRRRA